MAKEDPHTKNKYKSSRGDMGEFLEKHKSSLRLSVLAVFIVLPMLLIAVLGFIDRKLNPNKVWVDPYADQR